MTTREQAIQWWKNLGDSFFEKIQLKEEITEKYFPKRNFGTLTGSEIEAIYKCEHLNEAFKKDNVKIRVKPQTENIYLNRLKEQYKQYKEKQSIDSWSTNKMYYDAMRLFCLDTQLISFNDIEVMESEVNSVF